MRLGNDGTLRVAAGVKAALSEDKTQAESVTLQLKSGAWQHSSVVPLDLRPLTAEVGPYPQLWWAQLKVVPPGWRFRDYEVTLEWGGRTYFGKKRAGWRDRDVLARMLASHFPQRLIHKCLGFLAGKLFAQNRPVLAVHLWHEDVGLKLLHSSPWRDQWSEVILLVPENLPDRDITTRFTAVASDLGFRRITTLSVPARGRDIGGLVSLLLHLQKYPSTASRPCLYLHTKKSSHLPDLISSTWMDMLLSRVFFRRGGLLAALARLRYFRAAVVASREAQRKEVVHGKGSTLPQHSSELAAQVYADLFGDRVDSFEFCAGTMMWFMPGRTCRAWTASRLSEVLERLEDSRIMQEPSVAHAFERMFPEAVRRSGERVVFS